LLTVNPPLIFAPIAETDTTFATPFAEISTLKLPSITTLAFPLTILELVVIPVS
jgi:hypothetical protein